MTQYQRADSAAFDELVRRISPALLRYFKAFYWNRDHAEDLLQDCWIKIHTSRHTYRPAEPVMPWVYGIARHTNLDAYRKRRRRQSREVLVAHVPDPPPLAMSEISSASQDLDQAIGSLPESQREVIFLLKVAGMTVEEVAKATSSTVGAVKQKSHRAYTTLRKLLNKEGQE